MVVRPLPVANTGAVWGKKRGRRWRPLWLSFLYEPSPGFSVVPSTTPLGGFVLKYFW